MELGSQSKKGTSYKLLKCYIKEFLTHPGLHHTYFRSIYQPPSLSYAFHILPPSQSGWCTLHPPPSFWACSIHPSWLQDFRTAHFAPHLPLPLPQPPHLHSHGPPYGYIQNDCQLLCVDHVIPPPKLIIGTPLIHVLPHFPALKRTIIGKLPVADTKKQFTNDLAKIIL